MSLLTFTPATPASEGAQASPDDPSSDFEPAGEMTNLSFSEATELLDLLERRGVRDPEVVIAESGAVTVRWAA